MSGTRQRGISYGPTVKLNDVNDAVCGGATNQGTGSTLYGGILGIEIEFTDSQVIYDSTVGTLYGGVYKYVQTYSGSTASPVLGHVAFWYNQDSFIVTADATDGMQAGIFLNAITKGNFGWIQVGGKATVVFRATITKATPAVGDEVVVESTASVADVLADATDVTWGGSAGIKLRLGTAIVAPTGGAASAVELFNRYSSPFA